MAELSYPMVVLAISEDEGGGFMAYAPDLPGCMADGATPEEAIADLKSAIVEWIDEARRLERVPPEPGAAGEAAQKHVAALKALVDAQDTVIRQQRRALAEADKQAQRHREVLAGVQVVDIGFDVMQVSGIAPVPAMPSRRRSLAN